MTITERRVSLDLSLRECAQKAGLKPSELSMIEQGSARPTEEQKQALCKVLGINDVVLKESLPTDEDVAELEAVVANFKKATSATREDANARGLGKGNGGMGEILCPVCGTGRLKYSVAGVNGHIWGACSTEGCVRWMQ